MPRTAFVHIGVPKTGSTAIQAAFSEARADLRAAGYHYPSGAPNHGERLALAFWDRADALRLAGLRWKDGAAAERHVDAARDAVTADAVACAPDHMVLSDEILSEFHPGEVRRLVGFLQAHFDRVRVIAFLRDPLDWATSAAQQATKWSGDTLERLFERPRLPDYAGRLGPWIDVLGREALDLRLYGAGDVVGEVSAAIGLARAPGGTAAARLNEGVSHRTAILFSRFNSLRPPFVDCRHTPVRSYDLTRTGRLPGRRFTLPRETVEAAAEALRAEADWANACLGRDAFGPPALPEVSRDDWFGGERAALEEFAGTFLETSRSAQNERALRAYLTACRRRGEPALAQKLLDRAWLLATDRWTLDPIAREALEQDRGDREKFFAKGRLMRRIEAPEPGDPPLVIGNPFDRPWRAAKDAASAAA